MQPREARRVSWPELDSLQHGYAVRRQRDLYGFRALYTQMHNLHRAEKTPAVAAAELWALPAIDGAVVEKPVASPEFLERMRARFGDRLQA